MEICSDVVLQMKRAVMETRLAVAGVVSWGCSGRGLPWLVRGTRHMASQWAWSHPTWAERDCRQTNLPCFAATILFRQYGGVMACPSPWVQVKVLHGDCGGDASGRDNGQWKWELLGAGCGASLRTVHCGVQCTLYLVDLSDCGGAAGMLLRRRALITVNASSPKPHVLAHVLAPVLDSKVSYQVQLQDGHLYLTLWRPCPTPDSVYLNLLVYLPRGVGPSPERPSRCRRHCKSGPKHT